MVSSGSDASEVLEGLSEVVLSNLLATRELARNGW